MNPSAQRLRVRCSDWRVGATIGGVSDEHPAPEGRNRIPKWPLEGREGFEPATPGLKVRACAPDPSSPTADSNSAVLTVWTDRFLIESSTQVQEPSGAPDSTRQLYVLPVRYFNAGRRCFRRLVRANNARRSPHPTAQVQEPASPAGLEPAPGAPGRLCRKPLIHCQIPADKQL